MDRYIDVDELLNNLPDDLPYKASVKRVLIQAPTADVVPKSEVEALKHQLEMIIDEGEYWQGKYLVARSTVAREIFEDIEKAILTKFPNLGCDILKFAIAELKKKYTKESEDTQ